MLTLIIDGNPITIVILSSCNADYLPNPLDSMLHLIYNLLRVLGSVLILYCCVHLRDDGLPQGMLPIISTVPLQKSISPGGELSVALSRH